MTDRTADDEPTTVDEYLAAQPEPARVVLAELRRLVLSVHPDAVESIAYKMAAYEVPNGRWIYFAGWKQHCSLHGVPEFDADFEAEVSPYRSGRGTLKFPFRKPVPYPLIERIFAVMTDR